MTTTLSVAMCTYNGAPFVGQQLQSIVEQIRRPDELVVCDDGSSDRTLEVVESFAARAGFCVRIHRNEHNLGSTKNFEQCIGLCRGDIIALCDQDDIWLPEKLATLERVLEENPKTGLVFSDAELVAARKNDGQSAPLPWSLWDSLGLTGGERRRAMRGKMLDLLLRRNVVTGATMAFRARFRNVVLPIPNEWVHDGWIALLISAVTETAMVPRPLLRYRQHAEQQIGEHGRRWRKELQKARQMDRGWFEREAAKFEAAADRLANACPDMFYGRLDHRFAGKIAHQRARVQMRSGSLRLPLIFAELGRGRYRHYSLGWKSLAQDLFL